MTTLTSLINSKKHNYIATADPTTTDDASVGYDVGSEWVNVSTDTAFKCLDSTTSAAVWEQINGAGGGSGTVGRRSGYFYATL